MNNKYQKIDNLLSSIYLLCEFYNKYIDDKIEEKVLNEFLLINKINKEKNI